MTRLAIVSAMVLGACAGPRYATPCQVQTTIVLETTLGADARCRAMGAITGDDGKIIEQTQLIRGCAKAKEALVITSGKPGNLQHEMEHVWDYHCRRR